MEQRWNGKNIWRIIYPMLLYMFIAYMVQYVIATISSVYIVNQYQEQMMELETTELMMYISGMVNKELLAMNALAGFVAIPIFVLFMYLDTLKEKEMGIFIKYKETNYLHYLVIIPLAVSSMIMGNAVVSVIQAFMSTDMLASYDETAEIIYSSSIFVRVMGTVVAAPIIEELIFRGLVFKRVRQISGPKIAIFVSGLTFGLFHMNAVQAVYGFIIGVILAYLYEKYKSIAAPILMHSVANFVSVLATSMTTQEELQQTQDIVYTQTQLIALCQVAVWAGVFTVLFLIVVHKIEKPIRVAE